MKTLEKNINRGDQYVSYSELLTLKKFKVKLSIKSDSYDMQCYAKAYVWSKTDLRWNNVSFIHYSNMKTPDKLKYNRESNLEKYFLSDREKLIEQVKNVLA